MLKVFLVEDEYVVRQGIKRNIEWEKNGLAFVGEAADGELAYPLILKEKPDIVITDIRMPFVDGLTLSRMIKSALPDTEIIILTGHEAFEYAKEGIQIGVAEYLTKPISSEQLLEAIRKVAVRIEEKQKDQLLIAQYKKEMEEDAEEKKRQLFSSLMEENFALPDILEKATKLGMDFSAVYYNIALIKVNSTKHESTEYSKRMVKTGIRLKELSEAEHFYLIDRTLEGSAIIFTGNEPEALKEREERVLSAIVTYLKNFDDVRFFIGVGEPVSRLREIRQSFDQASHAFANRFLREENTVLYYRDMKKSDVSVFDVKPKQFDRSRVVEFLRTGEEPEIVYFVEEFFNDLGSSMMKSKLFLQYIVMDIYFCVTEFVAELQMPVEDIEKIVLDSSGILNMDEAKSYITQIITQGIGLRNQVSKDKYADVVKLVLKYIEEHYMNEELSLNEIASYVNFSPNHLSTIFSQQTGKNFIKYLTEYRMNKAKELMKCSNKKTSVIAYEVGYKDPHYFSYLFKKTQGITPTQFRAK